MSTPVQTAIDPIVVGSDAFARLASYCAERYPDLPVTLVADTRTVAAAGNEVARVLTRAGRTVRSIILRGDNLHADELGIARVLTASPYEPSLFVAVGSGTITDITRYVSFRLGQPFVSVPTASSVDGFASIGSPLVIDGVKRTHAGQTPRAIFVDTTVIAAAPAILTASGFGDLLGKITSIADWRLGRLIRDEPFDEAIAARATAAVERCVAQVDAIGRRELQAVETLFHALTDTGLCMIEFGESRPASGAEHHISHFWEMAMLRLGMATALHGMQVGIATAIVAEFYQKLRGLTAADVSRLLAERVPLGEHAQEAEIRAAYGPLADAIIRDHAEYLELSTNEQTVIAERLVERWDEVLEIARTVPEPDSVKSLLLKAGAPVEPVLLNLPTDQLAAGISRAHYLRNRFTSAKLCHMLGLLDTD